MKNFLKLDWILLSSALLLIAIGLILLYSVSLAGGVQNFEHFYKQIIAILIGTAIMAALSILDYRALIFYSTKIYFAAIVILTAVILWGTKIRGTAGWIGFGKFHIQPVEIVKLVIIIFFAGFLSKKKDKLSHFSRIAASFVLVFIPVILIFYQPDFGSAVIIIGIWVGMLITSGIDKKNLFLLLLIGTVVSSFGWFFLKDYQRDRLVNFINPLNDPRGSGYNVIQSIVAVGSGGLYGKGLGHGSQSQLNFLPEKHTDFIFAVVAEELGLMGSLMVLGLFGVIIFRMREIARLSRDNFGYLLVVGVMIMIISQMLVNVGMNTGIAPVAGVPLPFLSYGGSSMVVMLASLGIVQSVYLKRIKIA